jgi:CHRD domain
MKRLRILIAVMVGLLATATVASAERIEATLTGDEEVPVVSTVASGEFRARISFDEQSIDYVLTYSGLQGTVTQGHIHVAQPNVNGVIVVWLCQTQASPSPVSGTPTCPESGSVSGTITAADVVQPAPPTAPTQQILAGELFKVIAAIRAGFAYANVHTNLSPGGEIRGQIEDKDNKKDKGDKDDKGNRGQHH